MYAFPDYGLLRYGQIPVIVRHGHQLILPPFIQPIGQQNNNCSCCNSTTSTPTLLTDDLKNKIKNELIGINKLLESNPMPNNDSFRRIALSKYAKKELGKDSNDLPAEIISFIDQLLK